MTSKLDKFRRRNTVGIFFAGITTAALFFAWTWFMLDGMAAL